MVVFADNDILIKLAGCSLLDRFLEALNEPNIRVASTTRFSIVKQAEKMVSDPARVQSLLEWLQDVPDADAVQDFALLDALAECNGIDPGEQRLFAAFSECADSPAIATGDRRALRAIIQNSAKLQGLYDGLCGNVFTLEIAFLFLIETYGFEIVDELVRARAIEDKVIAEAFGAGRNADHAKACLSSRTREVLPLLAHPHLVIAPE